MKMPKVILRDENGEIIGEKSVRSATWGIGGKLEVIHVDHDGILPMYDLMERGIFSSLDTKFTSTLIDQSDFFQF